MIAAAYIAFYDEYDGNTLMPLSMFIDDLTNILGHNFNGKTLYDFYRIVSLRYNTNDYYKYLRNKNISIRELLQ